MTIDQAIGRLAMIRAHAGNANVYIQLYNDPYWTETEPRVDPEIEYCHWGDPNHPDKGVYL
jgi:hypothetical protein